MPCIRSNPPLARLVFSEMGYFNGTDYFSPLRSHVVTREAPLGFELSAAIETTGTGDR